MPWRGHTDRVSRNGTLAMLAVALGIVALTIAVSRGTGDEPTIALGETPAPVAAALEPAIVVVERELAPPTEREVEPPAITPAQPPAPAGDSQDSEQASARAVKALVDAGIAEEVANGMVAIVEQLRSMHPSSPYSKEHSSGWYASELLLAIWPDLPDMIRRGDVKPEIVAFPPHNWNQPKAPVVTNLHLPDGELSYALSMERWSVRFSFAAKANPKPELFAKLLEAEGKK